MKRKDSLILVSLIGGLSNPCLAATPVDIPASVVNGQCTKVLQGSYDVITAGLCTYLITGYIHGYHVGIKTGVRAAFTKDTDNLRTTKGIQDIQTRVLSVEQKASCIPESATINDITKTFVRYMSAHPEAKDEQYYQPLERALEEAFPCLP